MLDKIPTSEELRAMKDPELRKIASDIREFIIEKVSKKGGHLASNLGTVELSLALFSVFDFPEDKVIFDVGHQSYTWKILTGRADEFDTLRDYGGLSGFPKRRESKYDSFNTGHSSTSISAGLGFVHARDLMKKDYHVISVIGDGSMTGGMAFEALNNAASLKSNFIIILNDNDMSIGENAGGMHYYLMNMRAGRRYNKAKSSVKKTLNNIPGVGTGLVSFISNTKDSMKEMVLPDGMVFENLGITYLGPVDGHNVREMRKIFLRAKELPRCVLIHVKTRKGKGYPPAEKNPERWHGVGPFDPETGKPKKAAKNPEYSGILCDFLSHAAKEYPDLCAITAAMGDSTGLSGFQKAAPERFFDVGIAEQHAVTFAAGLAASGMHPLCAIYSSFLQRAYDQIVHDVCMQDLPVLFCIDRAGIVGRDGETHQGVFDISFLSSFPNMTLMAPKNAEEFRQMLKFATDYRHPLAIRYPRGEACTDYAGFNAPLEYGKAELIREGKEVLILSAGSMLGSADRVRELLREQGHDAAVLNMRFLKPWDREQVFSMIQSGDFRLIATVEDGIVKSGFGSGVAAAVSEAGFEIPVLPIGIPDEFVPQGDVPVLYEKLGMDPQSIAKKILGRLS